MTLAEDFDRLFGGRRDVFGAVHGQCVRERLTLESWDWHLQGKGSVGVYPLVNGQVIWGASDIDRGLEMFVLAKNLWKALKVLGITSWIERSRSKGYHVWIFCDDWVPAEDMRNALLVAHAIAGVPPTEVNPKQTSLKDGEYGNYVNVPYAKTFADQAKRVVLDPMYFNLATGHPHLPVSDFANLALANLNSPEAIATAAAKYVAPPPKRAVAIEKYDGGLDHIVKKLGGLAFTVFNEGPLPDSDRSKTLTKLAHLCREEGLPTGHTLALLVDADSRWGKFSERPDGREQLERIVKFVYGDQGPSDYEKSDYWDP